MPSDYEKAAKDLKRIQQENAADNRKREVDAAREAKRREQMGHSGTSQAVDTNSEMTRRAAERMQVVEPNPETGKPEKKTSFSQFDMPRSKRSK